MSNSLDLIYCYITLISAVSNRNGILEATYDEILAMNQDNDFEYLQKPLIITDSPMIKWNLYESINQIYDDQYEINCKQQTTNCSCIDQINDINITCQEYGSSFLYTSDNDYFQHYRIFEGTNYDSYKYKKCINISENKAFVQKLYNFINSSEYKPNSDGNNNETNQFTKLYSYFRILSIPRKPDNHDEDEEYDEEHHDAFIDGIQLNILDRIHLWPYFDIFNLSNGYQDINDMHLWFGTEYYRAIRHYDKPNNK